MLTAVVSIFCALQEESRREVYSRCIRALKPGGVFILEGFAEGQLLNELSNDGPKEVDRLLTPGTFKYCSCGIGKRCCASLGCCISMMHLYST